MTGDGAGSDGTGDMDREVERLSSDLLERRVPSGDAPAPPASPATLPATPPAAPPAPPVDVLFEGLEDISTDLHALDVLSQPLAPTTPSAAVASAASDQKALDGMLAGVTEPADGLGPLASEIATDASVAIAAPLGPGASYRTRHQRNVLMSAAALLVLVGFIAALLALQGGGGAPGTPADLAAVTQASAASPVDPSPVDPSLVAPPDESTPTPEPTPTPAPTPGNVTIRGPIDASEVSAVGLRVGTHEALLAFDPKGGPVSGTFTIELEEFPIGSLLTSTFDGEKDARYAAFKKCTVTLALVGKVNGTYDFDAGKMSGKAVFKAATDDVDDCLKTRPSNISIDPDEFSEPTTVKWRAKFNGTRATGSLDLEPVMDFSATVGN
jgi:hypothetical protein